MISAIAAVGLNWQLGLNGGLPWVNHAADMKWFQEITAGKTLLAGHTTYEAIKLLNGSQGRKIICDPILFNYEFPPRGETIIVGGAKTYLKYANQIDLLYLSIIPFDGECDCNFPIEQFRPEVVRDAIWRPS